MGEPTDTSAIEQAIDAVSAMVHALPEGRQLVQPRGDTISPEPGIVERVDKDHGPAIAERVAAVDTFLVTAKDKVRDLATHLDRIVDP